MIAVTFALPSESSDFVQLLRNRVRVGVEREVFSGSIAGKQVSVVHTGVGENVARARVATFLAAQRPQVLISAGFAGGLTNALVPGTVFLGENVSSAGIFSAARVALTSFDVIAGTIISVPAIVPSARERAELARTVGADAVDMETQHIAEICVAAAIPVLSLRAISDTPASPFPAPPEVLFDVEQQRTPFAPLFLHLLKNPLGIPRLVSFARQIAATRRSLATALQHLIESDAIASD